MRFHVVIEQTQESHCLQDQLSLVGHDSESLDDFVVDRLSQQLWLSCAVRSGIIERLTLKAAGFLISRVWCRRNCVMNLQRLSGMVFKRGKRLRTVQGSDPVDDG